MRRYGYFKIERSFAKINNNAFRLSVTYDIVDSGYEHRYTIKCVDTKNLCTIIIDSNVIDNDCFISLEDALARTKYYLKDRFNYEIVQIDIVPDKIYGKVLRSENKNSSEWELISKEEYERIIG